MRTRSEVDSCQCSEILRMLGTMLQLVTYTVLAWPAFQAHYDQTCDPLQSTCRTRSLDDVDCVRRQGRGSVNIRSDVQTYLACISRVELWDTGDDSSTTKP